MTNDDAVPDECDAGRRKRALWCMPSRRKARRALPTRLTCTRAWVREAEILQTLPASTATRHCSWPTVAAPNHLRDRLHEVLEVLGHLGPKVLVWRPVFELEHHPPERVRAQRARPRLEVAREEVRERQPVNTLAVAAVYHLDLRHSAHQRRESSHGSAWQLRNMAMV
eukprot:5594882-Pleurochrysis_carterae.AAC.2